jgi:hypothetical protein
MEVKKYGFRIWRPVANPEWFHPVDTQVIVEFSKNLTDFG